MTRYATRVVHAGLEPDPSYGGVVPAIHQASTYVQPAPGEFVEDFDYSRSANPTRAALEQALGELEGGHATAFASGMAATHALLSAVCSAGDPVRDAVELLSGEGQAITVSEAGRPVGIVTRADLLESLAS